MGTCRFCGEPTDFLRGEHQQCRDWYMSGCANFPVFFRQALGENGASAEVFLRVLKGYAASVGIDDRSFRDLARKEVCLLDREIASAHFSERDRANFLAISDTLKSRLDIRSFS
jgi:hypothetical protein